MTTSPEAKFRTRWVSVAGLLLLVAGAAALRLWGIGWALPYVDHPDEPEVARAAFHMVQRNSWNPYFFDYPSLYLYALRIVFDWYWRYQQSIGAYLSLDQVPPRFSMTPAAIYLAAPGFFWWGRVLSATFGTLTVAALGSIGQRWWNWAVGLMAAAFLAVLPFHARHSQYITVDVATACTTLLALGACLRVLHHTRLRDYMLAGLAVGIAASTKYNAAAVCVALIVAHCGAWGRGSLRQFWRLPVAGLCSLVGFAMFTPYAVIAPSEVLQGLAVQYRDYAGGHRGDAVGRWPVGAYAWFFWNTGLGRGLSLLALVGIAVIVWRRDRAGLALLAFVAAHIGLLLNWPEHFWRNLMPVFPPLLACAAIGATALAEWFATGARRALPLLSNRRATMLANAACALLAVCAILTPFGTIMRIDSFDATPDARVRVAAYMAHMLPPQAKVAAELNPAQWRGSASVTPVPDVAAHDAAWYRQQGFRYLVTNQRYRTAADRAAYEALRAQSTLVCAFDDEPYADPTGLTQKLSRTYANPFHNARIELRDLAPNSTAPGAPACSQ